jgi:hypothetical protein
MRNFSHLPAAVLLLVLSGQLAAQIYQTKGAEGHPVFSDTPSQDAVRVDIGRANIAESVEPQPPAEAPTPGAAGSSAAGAGSQIVDRQFGVHNEDAYWGAGEKQERERHSEKRHEVGDDTDMSRHEVGDDVDLHRHQVGYHLVEHSHSVGADDHDHTLSGFDNQGDIVQRHIVVHRRVHRR